MSMSLSLVLDGHLGDGQPGSARSSKGGTPRAADKPKGFKGMRRGSKGLRVQSPGKM